MATPSDSPPDEKPPNPAVADNQDSQAGVVKESSPPSVFVNSEPIREAQVQNAIKFLSHPNVRVSPVIHRRSFLERKGLTKQEINEAFRRVPDQAPPTQPVVNNQDGLAKSSSLVNQQPPTQALQPTPAGPVGTVAKMGTFYRFHWSHAFLAVGFLAASGAGTALLFKKSIIPRFKSWIRKVVYEEEDEEGQLKTKDAKPSVQEEAAAAAKAAAAAATDVARVSQEMLVTKSEEKRCFEELISLLNVQMQEMKSMSTSIQKLEGGQNINRRITVEQRDDQRFYGTGSRQPYTNGKADTDLRSVRSLSPPAPVEPSAAPHPKSYMEIMSMIQRGEKPSNIRDINDAPPNPNQPLPNSSLAPRPKPWEVNQSQSSSTNTFPVQDNSYNGTSYELPGNQLNGGSAVPWWQQKNVRITEIEGGEEQKFGSSGVPVNERPIQRSWVPPQPPPVVMAEAAAAIRQPKKPLYQMTDDQLLSRAPDVSDELQRITKISELGGSVEANVESSGFSSNEIQVEENGSYMESINQ